MRTALYCYWGAVGDHNLNIPGHPLYQLYNLEFLAKKFQIDKVYFFSFLKNKVEATTDAAKFFIKEADRTQITSTLNIEVIGFGDALKKVQEVDVAFIKARFRNKSRLQERSFDALKFEELLKKSEDSRTYVIDSDGELPIDFFNTYNGNLLTFFLDHQFYDKYETAPADIATIAPACVERFQKTSFALADKPIDIFFIGNEGLKQPRLSSWLNKAAEDQLEVAVQGKWKTNHSFQIYSRTDREIAYKQFEKTLATLQMSKPKYREFSFLSPRIYEAGIVGAVPLIESGYACASEFTSVDSYVEFREKLKCLREGYERDFKLIFDEQVEILEKIENNLLKPSSKLQKHL